MRAFVSEGIGTGLLVAAVVGSGIMGERLAGGNLALTLLANSIATGAVLVTLIFTFGPASGAHFNPAVTLAAALEGGIPWRRVPGYLLAQITGAILGVMAAHLMFELPLVALSQQTRTGPAQLFSEFVATFGLLVVVHGTGKHAAVVPLTFPPRDALVKDGHLLLPSLRRARPQICRSVICARPKTGDVNTTTISRLFTVHLSV